jgi:hypothetical protein
MGSERIPAALPRGRASESNNKQFLTLDCLLSFRREDQYESTLPQKQLTRMNYNRPEKGTSEQAVIFLIFLIYWSIMGRFSQPSDACGSLQNIQILVNKHPSLFVFRIKERVDRASKNALIEDDLR